MWWLLLLQQFFYEVSSSSNNVSHCYLTIATMNTASNGQLDCQMSALPNLAHSGTLTLKMSLIQVRWREGQFVTKIVGLNSTVQISQFAPYALKSLVSTEGLFLQYLNMDVLRSDVLEPLGESLRRLRLSDTSLTSVTNNNFGTMRALELLVFTDNLKLSCIADEAFQGLQNLHELRIERSPALQSLPFGAFQNLISLRTLVLEDTGLITLSPRLFCSLFRLENFEWSSRHHLLNVTCLTLAALTQLRSLNIKQRPNEFDERNLVQDSVNAHCIMCPLRQLNHLDGQPLQETLSSESCPAIEFIKQMCSESIYLNETCNWLPTQPLLTTQVSSSDSELSTLSILSVSLASSSTNSSITIAWLIAAFSIVMVTIIVGFWCFRKRLVAGINCIEYCQLLMSKSYPIHHTQKITCSTPRDLHNEAGFIANGKDENDYEIVSMLRTPPNAEGTFFVIKNGQWPIVSDDNLSLHSKSSSCSNDSKIPTTFI